MQTKIESLSVRFQRGEDAILGREVSVRGNMLKRVVQGLLRWLLDAILWRSMSIVTVRAHMLKRSLANDGTTLICTQRMKSTWFFLLKIVCNG